MLTIRAETVRLLLPFICTEETRYYLNGVCVQPCDHGGVVVVATNGHIMGVVHDPEGSTDRESTIVHLSADLARALKPAKRDDDGRPRWLRMADDGTPSVALFSEREVDPACKWHTRYHGPDDARVDGTFPDWRRVWPAAELIGATAQRGTSYGYNAAYLEAIAKNTRTVIGDTVPMRVWDCHVVDEAGAFGGPPAVVTFSYSCDHPRLVALLMPMASTLSHKLPDFLRPASTVEARAA